jgi:hypothetical protein
MVIAAPEGEIEITCGGAPLIGLSDEPAGDVSIDPTASTGTLIGKRYVSESGELELLCTKPGEGTLAVEDAPLAIKGSKPLPSSD